MNISPGMYLLQQAYEHPVDVDTAADYLFQVVKSFTSNHYHLVAVRGGTLLHPAGLSLEDFNIYLSHFAFRTVEFGELMAMLGAIGTQE
jgi:hypothetical protein